MSETWGKGTLNNTIGWGQGACTATNDWGKSQKDSSVAASWSGDTDISGCSGAAGLAQIDNLNSMQFDGADEYISGSDLGLGVVDKFSITGWWKYPALPNNPPNPTIPANQGMFNLATTSFMDGTSGFPAIGLSIATHGGGELYLDCYINNNILRRFRVVEPVTNVQSWRTYTIVYDGTKGTGTGANDDRFIVYINGVRPTINSNFSGTVPSTTDLTNCIPHIGVAKRFTLADYNNGLLDEVAYFNTALTEAEILSIYNATAVVDGVNKTADLSQLTTPPVAWYRM